MSKRILALALALALCIGAAAACAEETRSFHFDLRFQMDSDATDWQTKSIRSGIAWLLDVLRVEGTLSVNGDSFNLPFELTLDDSEETRTSFRLWGVPSHYALTSSLLGDTTLMINNLALLEFADKAYDMLDLRLSYPALFVSPYVHTSAFDWARPAWKEIFFAKEGSRVVPYEDVQRFAELTAETGTGDRALRYWLRSLAGDIGYNDDILEAMGNAPAWVEENFSPDGIQIDVSEEGETWKTGEWTLFASTNDGWDITLPPSLSESCCVTISCRRTETELHYALRLSDEDEEAKLTAEADITGILKDFPCDGEMEIAFHLQDNMAESEHSFRYTLTMAGSKATLVRWNKDGDPIVRIRGTVEEVTPAEKIHYTPGDILGIPGYVNILSVDDASLAELVNNVKDSFLDGFLPLLVHTPAQSYRAFFDFLEEYGILSMLTQGLEEE